MIKSTSASHLFYSFMATLGVAIFAAIVFFIAYQGVAFFLLIDAKKVILFSLATLILMFTPRGLSRLLSWRGHVIVGILATWLRQDQPRVEHMITMIQKLTSIFCGLLLLMLFGVEWELPVKPAAIAVFAALFFGVTVLRYVLVFVKR